MGLLGPALAVVDSAVDLRLGGTAVGVGGGGGRMVDGGDTTGLEPGIGGARLDLLFA